MKTRLLTAIMIGLAMSLLVGGSVWVLAQPVATITLPAPGAARQLYSGCNNIGVTFPDGTPSQTVIDAVTPAGAVDTMWRHNAALNKFDGYSPKYPQASDLLTVNFVDAVWLCMVQGLSAVAPTATPPPVQVIPPVVVPVCGGPPAVASFAANPGTITAGQQSTLNWTGVQNVDTLTIDQGVGQVTGGSVNVSPPATTTYTLTATGCGGMATYQTTVTVNAGPVQLPVANVHPSNLRIDYNDPALPVMLTITNDFSEGKSSFTMGLQCTMDRYLKGQTNLPPDASQTNDLGQITVNIGWGFSTDVGTGFSSLDLVHYTFIVSCTITPVDFTHLTGNSYQKQFD